ncbi:hypothetical protein SKAU_G00303130 [Synaphobranchus kaupii]|uniref:BRISC and BRCA1-A complex member 2 n=1 Tax=Synaphobranchus kaupii TaxID=118154 RepID=A0A9Q1ILC7_SYNKA|nr:hypothetical protein SKAU_G00303130 [Synaphobranchus kaupii]
MNSMSPEVALNRISPELRPLLTSVVRNGRVGLDSTNCLRVTDLKTGCTSLTPGPCCDRFKLHIPYAGETLKWDIIFNARDPELPPDFIFGEDAEFLPEPSELPVSVPCPCVHPSRSLCPMIIGGSDGGRLSWRPRPHDPIRTGPRGKVSTRKKKKAVAKFRNVRASG